MKRMDIFLSRRLPTIIVILFSLLVLMGCENRGDVKSGEGQPFRFAFLTWVNHGPFYLAKEKGFYQKHGLTVDMQKIEDIGAQKLALQAGKLDGTISSVDFFATAAAEGVKAKTIMKLGAGDGADAIIAKEGISSVPDLKDHTVAVEKGGPDHFFLLFVLKENGMSSKDIKPIFMTTADAGAAYVSGAVDACVVWEPWVTNAVEKRKSKILATSRDRSGVLVDTFVVRDDVLQNRRNDVKAFMMAWFDAIEYWKSNPEEANKIMATGLGISEEEFAVMLQGVKLADYQDNLAYFGTDSKPGQYWQVFDSANTIYKSEHVIETPADPKSVTDTSLLLTLYK